MTTINVDPDEVRRAASILRNCADNINEKLNIFNDISDEIAEAWKSRYTSQYLGCLETTESNIRKTKNAVKDAADDLEKIAEAVEKAEAEIKRIAGGAGRGGGGGGGGRIGGR